MSWSEQTRRALQYVNKAAASLIRVEQARWQTESESLFSAPENSQDGKGRLVNELTAGTQAELTLQNYYYHCGIEDSVLQ